MFLFPFLFDFFKEDLPGVSRSSCSAKSLFCLATLSDLLLLCGKGRGLGSGEWKSRSSSEGAPSPSAPGVELFGGTCPTVGGAAIGLPLRLGDAEVSCSCCKFRPINDWAQVTGEPKISILEPFLQKSPQRRWRTVAMGRSGAATEERQRRNEEVRQRVLRRRGSQRAVGQGITERCGRRRGGQPAVRPRNWKSSDGSMRRSTGCWAVARQLVGFGS